MQHKLASGMLAFAVGIWGPQAVAQTITFEADSDVLVVRGFQTPLGFIQFDIVGSRDGTVLCLALDEADQPVATTTGLAQIGYVAFLELELDAVSRVVCRYN